MNSLTAAFYENQTEYFAYRGTQKYSKKIAAYAFKVP